MTSRATGREIASLSLAWTRSIAKRDVVGADLLGGHLAQDTGPPLGRQVREHGRLENRKRCQGLGEEIVGAGPDRVHGVRDRSVGGHHDEAAAKAAVAHLWFVTIHPFEDGNGRIARAIADMALARSDGTAQRFYSMSSQIQRERKDPRFLPLQSLSGLIR